MLMLILFQGTIGKKVYYNIAKIFTPYSTPPTITLNITILDMIYISYNLQLIAVNFKRLFFLHSFQFFTHTNADALLLVINHCVFIFSKCNCGR